MTAVSSRAASVLERASVNPAHDRARVLPYRAPPPAVGTGRDVRCRQEAERGWTSRTIAYRKPNISRAIVMMTITLAFPAAARLR